MKARQVGVTLGILIGMGLVGCSPQQGESADRAGKAAEEAVKAAREAGDKAAQALGKASDAVIEASRAIGVRPEAKAPVEPTGPGDTASATPTDPPAGPATRDAMEATREAAANLLTHDALDPWGKIPEFKYSAVRLTAVED